jgi:two-component system, NarL family, response regulator LiaR
VGTIGQYQLKGTPMSNPDKIRVIIVDDHDIVRHGLAIALGTFDDLEVVGQAADGNEALALCDSVHPDVVLMDLVMPQMDGISATRAIRSNHPDIKVVALTSFKEQDKVHGALQAGAIGYILKNTSINNLAHTIRAAADGHATFSAEVTSLVLDPIRSAQKYNYNLTERESEVLRCMIDGMNNPQIADALKISQSTVKFHVSVILGKLGVNSRTKAVAMAVEQKLTS